MCGPKILHWLFCGILRQERLLLSEKRRECRGTFVLSERAETGPKEAAWQAIPVDKPRCRYINHFCLHRFLQEPLQVKKQQRFYRQNGRVEAGVNGENNHIQGCQSHFICHYRLWGISKAKLHTTSDILKKMFDFNQSLPVN